jgi:hypothetical protein
MVDWYRNFDAMQRQSDAYEAVPLGALRVGRTFLCAALFLLILFALFHQARLWTGSVSWLGMAESSVKAAPGWMQTPLSANAVHEDLSLSLPMFAMRGQDIVVRHSLSSPDATASAPRARLLISCLCPTENWHHFTIDGPGSGETAFPVRDGGFYSVDILQSSGPDGRTSIGTYRWGLRAGR